MYIARDWTTRDIAHLSLVPVGEATEALCGALSTKQVEGDEETHVVQRCARCARRARALVGTTRPHSVD